MDRTKTMERLRKRAEFLAVAGGARASRRGFLVQSRERDAPTGDVPRFGFTVTKKMGNSPERNRIRRRMREAVRLAAGGKAAPGADYVLIGRRAALSQPFEDLVRDLISGIDALKRPRATAECGRPAPPIEAAPPAMPGPNDRSAERSDR